MNSGGWGWEGNHETQKKTGRGYQWELHRRGKTEGPEEPQVLILNTQTNAN